MGCLRCITFSQQIRGTLGVPGNLFPRFPVILPPWYGPLTIFRLEATIDVVLLFSDVQIVFFILVVNIVVMVNIVVDIYIVL